MSRKPQRWYPQSSVIPYRELDGVTEILLITTRKGKWIVPKGVIDEGNDARNSALNEALEEAGVAGELDTEALGLYSYEKWDGMCRVAVFAMRVTEEFASWDEQDFRSREWVSASKAAERIASPQLRKILRRFTRKKARDS